MVNFDHVKKYLAQRELWGGNTDSIFLNDNLMMMWVRLQKAKKVEKYIHEEEIITISFI
jgi:hypothetical protein